MYLTYTTITAKPQKQCCIRTRESISRLPHTGKADVELMRMGVRRWFCARCGCVELGVKGKT